MTAPCCHCRLYCIATWFVAMCAITFGAFALHVMASRVNQANAYNEELVRAYSR